MAIEIKELAEYLGVKIPEKLEDFKAEFEPAYIRKDKLADDKELLGKLFAPKIGKMAGATQVAVISELKKVGLDISKDELKDLDLEKVVEYGLQKATGHFTAKIAELEAKNGTGNDEKVKELETKYGKLQSKYEQEHSLFESSKQNWEAKEQGWANEKKGIKLSSKAGDALKAIKWKTGVSEIEKKGFLATVNEKYKLDLDEKDELFIADIKGQRIPHPKKNGEFKNINEILEEEGKAANIWEGNPIAARATPQRPIHQNGPQIQQPAFNGPQNGRPRVLAAAAQANEGK